MKSSFLPIVLLVLVFSSKIYGQTEDTGTAAQRELHGGIEIGSDWIKAVALRLSNDKQGADVKLIYTEEIEAVSMRVGGGRLAPKVIDAIALAVQKLYLRMWQFHGVPREHVYVIGGSDLKADNLGMLADEVKSKTGKSVTFLNTETEVRLSLVSTIPRRYREGENWFDNRSISVLIDIGGGGIKGGYQQIRQPLAGDPYYDFVAVGIPRGITAFTDEVNQAAGENASLKKFALTSKALVQGFIKATLKKNAEGKPGLATRKKVYLGGGIVLAMATLLHPEDRRAFVPITMDEINDFHYRAVNTPQTLLNPDLLQLRDSEERKGAERDLEIVRSSFTPKSLVAGAEILKAVASEYNFQGEGKRIFFARPSYLSSILSYVRLQSENVPQP